ncbi:MAG: hypothetical protein PVF51_04045 [Nitrospirota bacterium]|jgi:hypothetical protein
MIRFVRRPVLLLLLVTVACAGPPKAKTPDERVHTFADIPIKELRAHPEDYVGAVFEEKFVFLRIWWSRDRARPGVQFLDLPTHFTARIAAAPTTIARIEFPPEADPLFEHRRDGTDVRLRVRFLSIYPASRSPVFAFEEILPNQRPGSDLEYLQR